MGQPSLCVDIIAYCFTHSLSCDECDQPHHYNCLCCSLHVFICKYLKHWYTSIYVRHLSFLINVVNIQKLVDVLCYTWHLLHCVLGEGSLTWTSLGRLLRSVIWYRWCQAQPQDMDLRLLSNQHSPLSRRHRLYTLLLLPQLDTKELTSELRDKPEWYLYCYFPKWCSGALLHVWSQYMTFDS